MPPFFHTSKVVELCSKEIANKLRVIDKARGDLRFSSWVLNQK